MPKACYDDTLLELNTALKNTNKRRTVGIQLDAILQRQNYCTVTPQQRARTTTNKSLIDNNLEL